MKEKKQTSIRNGDFLCGKLFFIMKITDVYKRQSQYYDGFSAGSFLDLTRVAKLNENMWTDLFMMNKEPLLFEIDTIIDHLCEYRDALRKNDNDSLRQLLKDGRELKEKSLEMLNQ